MAEFHPSLAHGHRVLLHEANGCGIALLLRLRVTLARTASWRLRPNKQGGCASV